MRTIFHVWLGVSGVFYFVGLLLRYKMLQHRFPRRNLTFWELLRLPRGGGLVFLTDVTDFDLTGRFYRRWAIRVETPLFVWFAIGSMIFFVIRPRW